MYQKNIPIKTRQGDEIIVSLSCPYDDTIRGYLPLGYADITVIEISIERLAGSGRIEPAVFSYIYKELSNVATEREGRAIFFYSCSTTNDIPYRSKSHLTLAPEEYRNKLFKSLFERFVSFCGDMWFDYENIFSYPEGNYYFHVIYDKNTIPVDVIDHLRDGIADILSAIQEGKEN